MRLFWILIFVLCFTATTYAFRVSSPPRLSHPVDQQQVNALQEYLENIWFLTQGEYNLDIVTTTKSQADNGDIWIITTGAVSYIQYKAQNRVFTVAPQ